MALKLLDPASVKTGFSRRDILKAAGLAVGAAACGDSARAEDPGDDTDPLTRARLLAEIDTFVVLCMENRSFDHYLGSRLIDEGWSIDGLTGDEHNPAPDGSRVPVWPMAEFTTADINHEWSACHAQWNTGANDGFVKAHAGANQRDPMGYHQRTQLPALYQLADASAVCDRYFASVMGPTWPNRFYVHGASSNGVKTNDPIPSFPNVFASLEAAGVTSMNYFHDVPWAAAAYHRLHGASPIESFFEAAKAGTLPQYSLIDPQFFGPGANDDHPDHDPRLGQALIASLYAALAQSPQWDRCMFVVTYDEHGGFFDHVPPPTVMNEANAGFEQLGFRVPTVVAGPRVKQGATITTQLDHVSIISTLTRRFSLPPLNARVTSTADLSLCLDPARKRVRPAEPLAPIEISQSALAARLDPGGEHVEIAAGADRLVARALDRRRESRAITDRVLRYGAGLGAVRLVS